MSRPEIVNDSGKEAFAITKIPTSLKARKRIIVKERVSAQGKEVRLVKEGAVLKLKDIELSGTASGRSRIKMANGRVGTGVIFDLRDAKVLPRELEEWIARQERKSKSAEHGKSGSSRNREQLQPRPPQAGDQISLARTVEITA